MPTRRALIAATLILASGLPALAADEKPFTAEGFAAAQAAGESIVVDISAPWCPTCKAQRPILDKLENTDKFSKLRVFRVDFDSQKEVVRAFKAIRQSTLIVFKGATETGRSVGDTDPASIAALLEKAL